LKDIHKDKIGMILIDAKEFAGTVYDNHLETIFYNKQDNPQGK
jgi:hypothetical protein